MVKISEAKEKKVIEIKTEKEEDEISKRIKELYRIAKSRKPKE